jgi:hypothetical protein
VVGNLLAESSFFLVPETFDVFSASALTVFADFLALAVFFGRAFAGSAFGSSFFAGTIAGELLTNPRTIERGLLTLWQHNLVVLKKLVFRETPRIRKLIREIFLLRSASFGNHYAQYRTPSYISHRLLA